MKGHEGDLWCKFLSSLVYIKSQYSSVVHPACIHWIPRIHPEFLSEIIICKEAKSGAEDMENECHDTRIQFMLWYFFPLQ